MATDSHFSLKTLFYWHTVWKPTLALGSEGPLTGPPGSHVLLGFLTLCLSAFLPLDYDFFEGRDFIQLLVCISLVAD